MDDTGKANSGTIEEYDKLDDAEDLLETITHSNCSEGVTNKNAKLLMDLGANKDVSELYIINYNRKDVTGKRASDAIIAIDYVLVR